MKINDIKNILKDKNPRDLANSEFLPAAVNIVFFEVEKGLSMIFTRRSGNVGTHKKQISFPGGKMDSSDHSLWDTAVRETCEEIGLCREKFELIGRLNDHLTISSFRVRPFVSYYHSDYPIQYIIEKDESDYILEISLDSLLDSSKWSMIDFNINSQRTIIPHFWYLNNLIWGVTGFILFDFLQTLGGLSSFAPLKDFRVEDLVKQNKITGQFNQ